jgi:hypothetical protein
MTITERQIEAHVVKCCCTSNRAGFENVFVMFNSKLPGPADMSLEVGDQVVIYEPWTLLQLPSTSVPVVLCHYCLPAAMQ